MDLTPVFTRAVSAGRTLLSAGEENINHLLVTLAGKTETAIPFLLAENEKDLILMEKESPLYDRLKLTETRLMNIAADIMKVASLPSPAGKTLYQTTRPNGLVISRISVPFGLVGIIYEARPNVTFDVFSLCLKSGNACILKGGSDAIHSNTAITNIIKDVISSCGLDPDIITLLPPGREETQQLLKAHRFVDLIIPRGSQKLIDYVRENASVPVIETGAGICHTYFDESGDSGKGQKVILNAKTRRVSVCNALDTLVVHSKRLSDLPFLVEPCSKSEVLIYADEEAYKHLEGKYPDKLLMHATDESFGTEFLSYTMAVKTVGSFTEALEHIGKHGSGHSEAIISEDNSRIEEFFRLVDASSLYSNTSTAFTDGSEFGLGAEIGISTQKLHARGPMALEALTTYKWIIRGNGQIRP
ncbi:MAG TPA: glutamate-5-semialdehyde dehydrogenase [Bacteroidales bacterium]|nr:glutamate-5-semialdehyde dehydrogenase [Bacteroidales bacterium]HRW83821.1 glutamate-5-semialdehyde dehydrogenase [Bacteroidales bacterium]